MSCANTKEVDHPAHSRSTKCSVVSHYQDRIIYILILRIKKVSVAKQAGVSITWSQNMEYVFLMT